jgi:hypothetical protein
MLNALETLISNACVNRITNQIVVKKGDRYFSFNAEHLAINFKAWLQLGVPLVNFWNHQNEYEYNRVAVLFTDVNETLKEQDKMSYSLVMPTFLRDDVGNYETYIEIVDENNIDVVVDGSPSYRFSSGGSGQKSNNNQIKKEASEKEQTQLLIDELREALEFMDAEEKQATKELIVDLREALKFM